MAEMLKLIKCPYNASGCFGHMCGKCTVLSEIPKKSKCPFFKPVAQYEREIKDLRERCQGTRYEW